MEYVAILAYLRHRALRRERVFRDPLDVLHVSDEHLLRYYRFLRLEIISLINEFDNRLSRFTRISNALPSGVRKFSFRYVSMLVVRFKVS